VQVKFKTIKITMLQLISRNRTLAFHRTLAFADHKRSEVGGKPTINYKGKLPALDS